jgi:hypothetical protein
MGFVDRWLENAIRQRMPVTLGGDHFRDTLGGLGPEYSHSPRTRIKGPCHITYVIQAAGVGLFSGDQVFELGSDHWPNPCDDLPVVFDRVCIDHIQIEWDRLPTHAEYLKQQINSGFSQPGAP